MFFIELNVFHPDQIFFIFFIGPNVFDVFHWTKYILMFFIGLNVFSSGRIVFDVLHLVPVTRMMDCSVLRQKAERWHTGDWTEAKA